MTIQEFSGSLSQKAAQMGFSDWEIVAEKGESFEVRIFKGEIAQYKNAYPSGLGFRGSFKGKMGYGATEQIDETVVDRLLRNAAQNAEIIEGEDAEFLYKGDALYPTVQAFNEKLSGVSPAYKIKLGKQMEQFAFEADPRVVAVDYCVVGSGEGALTLMNSYGLSLSHKRNVAYAYIYARVAEKGQTKVAGDVWFGNDFDDCDPKALARRAVGKAVSYLGASQVPSGKYTIMFDNITACDLLTAYAGVFFAERVQKGFSLLNNQVGVKIAADIVSLHDDGVCEKSFGSVPFDSEGVATQNKTVIDNGVLKTYLYNLKSAAKEGVQSTGNGFRQGLGGTVGTACTNLYMAPGDQSAEALLKQMKRGLLITELSGLHAGVNTISGDFSLSADGFYVEDGEIVKAVEQITVAGNFYDLLKHVKAVANDLRFDLPSGHGTIGMPSIVVGALDVSGE